MFQFQPPPKPNVVRFHTLLTELGVDLIPIYQSLSIDPALMELEDTSLPMSKYLNLLEQAAQQLGNPHLGMEIGLKSCNTDLGLLSYLLHNAPDFNSALHLLHRYIVLVAPGAETSLICEDDNCTLTYCINGISPENARQDVEGTIAQFVGMIRAILQDEQWQPEKLFFEHSISSAKGDNLFPFHCKVAFSYYFSGILFPAELIHCPNKKHDKQLLKLLEAQASQLIPQESLLDKIRLLISANLGLKDVTADFIARELGMSRRTLNRRLSDCDISFNRLREDIVFQLAKERLLNSNVSITELAQQLGYSDSSAFNRVFKRLSGFRPLQYRKTRP